MDKIKRLNSDEYINYKKKKKKDEIWNMDYNYLENHWHHWNPNLLNYWWNAKILRSIELKIDNSKLLYSNILLADIGIVPSSSTEKFSIIGWNGKTHGDHQDVVREGRDSELNFNYHRVCNEERYPGALAAYRTTLYQIMDEYITEKGVIDIISKYVAK